MALGEVCRRARRTPSGPEGLVVGIKCGAVDMTSGIASDPAVGAKVDSLVTRGGTVILSFDGEEVVEMTSLPALVAQAPIDKTVPLKIWRDGTE